MPVLRCATCRRSIDVEPVKCPYCGVVQPNRAGAAAVPPRQLAALLAAGLGLGAAVAPRTAPRAPSPAIVRPIRRAVPGQGLEEAARRRAHGLGPYRLVEVEDLFLTPAKLNGERVAVPGVIQRAKLGPGTPTIELGAQWGSQARVFIDVGQLYPDFLKTLVARQDAFHVFLVKGEVMRGDLAPGGGGYVVRAQEIEALGQTTALDGPAQAAKVMAEELKGR